MKVVINRCYGGFSLSRAAFLRLRELGQKNALEEPDIGEKWADGSGPRDSFLDDYFCDDIARNDPLLISVVEELGHKANGGHAKLKIVEIPDDVEWRIDEYDGIEWVAEKHRRWE